MPRCLPRRVLGSMPSIASRTTSSGCLAIRWRSVLVFSPPGKPVKWWYCLASSLLAVTRILAALITTTCSPVSRNGVKLALALPRSSPATRAASRPSTSSLASTKYHFGWIVLLLGKYVLMPKNALPRNLTQFLDRALPRSIAVHTHRATALAPAGYSGETSARGRNSGRDKDQR